MEEREQSIQSTKIVEMQPKHIESLELLEQICFSSPWSFDALVSELSNPLAVFRVAEIGSEIAGYAGMQHVLDEGYICNIAVHPQFRRQGVAADLIDALCEYAKENDMSIITLEVRKSNIAAQKLYEKFNFEVKGERKNFYSNPQEDALIMTKTFGRLF